MKSGWSSKVSRSRYFLNGDSDNTVEVFVESPTHDVDVVCRRKIAEERKIKSEPWKFQFLMSKGNKGVLPERYWVIDCKLGSLL